MKVTSSFCYQIDVAITRISKKHIFFKLFPAFSFLLAKNMLYSLFVITMLEEKEAAQCGQKPNQKLKTYFVLQYLLRESDREHPKNADDIVRFSDRTVSPEAAPSIIAY